MKPVLLAILAFILASAAKDIPTEGEPFLSLLRVAYSILIVTAFNIYAYGYHDKRQP